MRSLRGLLSLTILMVFFLSCAGNQSHISPPAQPDLSTQNISSPAGRVCWGIWDVFIDPETASAEIVPIRGASFMVNVVNFLQPPIAPTQLISIQIDPDESDTLNGLVVCDVTIQHPFPGTKFAGFDVMGIVLDDWTSCSSPSEPDILVSLPPATLLQNPDGWTRWWNQPEFTTYGTLLGYSEGALANHNWTSTHTLNAFKYFCDDLDTNEPFDPDPAARGFFSSEEPGINSRRYVLQFPGTVFHYKYAISASWAPPNPLAIAPYTPDDFLPEANMAEAYKIKIINAGSTAYYENGSSFGGNLNLYVEVRDWQLDGNLGSVTQEIDTVTIASPTLFPAPVVLNLALAELVPGNLTAVRIPVTIENVTPNGVDDQMLIVRVTSANVTTYEPQIPGISGYEYPDGPLAAYGIFEAPIITQGDENAWPMFRKGFSRSAYTGAVGPVTDNVKFTWEVPVSYYGLYSGYAVDSMGRVMVGSGNLNCIGTDGEVVWSYPLGGGGGYSCPSVGPDDSVYVGHSISGVGIELYHIDKNGELLWMVPFSYQSIDGGIAVLPDGCVLFGTWAGFLVKVDPLGNELWAYDTGDLSICGGPTVRSDGTIYFAAHESMVYALDQQGNEIWKKNTGIGDINACPALGPLGIYVGSHGYNICCLNYNGQVIWNTHLDGGIHNCAAVGDDGRVYVGCNDHKLYCLDQDNGDIIWDYETSNEIFITSPVLDGAGHVYVGNNDGVFHCITTDGDLVWEMDIGGEIRTKSPAISPDGTVFVSTKGGSFYAFQDE